jgi:hypothetical protein
MSDPENGRKCRICECTDFDGCASEDGGCSWIQDDVCSTCGEIAEALLVWFQEAGPLSRRNGKFVDALPAFHRMVAEVTDAIGEALTEVVLATEAEMRAIERGR